MSFSLDLPAKIILERGAFARAAAEISAYGGRVALVHSASFDPARVAQLCAALPDCIAYPSSGEPDLPALLKARAALLPFAPDVVVGLGGGAALDLAKALAALLPASGDLLRHFEIVGQGAALEAAPLPFIALPTTAGTGAEATKNAVISIPSHRVKVSLRAPEMMARLALIDPALTDSCPLPVTLASGLDALTQVIEPYLSTRANPLTDALCAAAIPLALPALHLLRKSQNTNLETQNARDVMAKVSLFGGIALANAGLGAAHGFAGPLGGQLNAPHGALCGRLLPEVLLENMRAGAAPERMIQIADWLGGGAPEAAFARLRALIDDWSLPRLGALGLRDLPAAVQAAKAASSMRTNPVTLSEAQLTAILQRAI